MNELKYSPQMAKASQICGIIAIVSIVTMTIYPAIVLGSTAIILSFLSRGERKILPDEAKTGLTTGIVALVVDLLIVAAAVMLLFSNGEYKKQVNTVFSQMYGYTFDEMIEDMKDGSLDLDYSNLPIK